MRRLALAVSLGLALAAGTARADDAADARSEYAAGTAALSKSGYREAAEHFEIAARLRPHAAAFYAAGKAWQLAGELVKSADRLSAALERAELSAADKQDAVHRLAAIEEKVGTVNVSGDAAMELQIDDGPTVHPPGARHASPGKHTLFIRGSSGATSREVTLSVGGALPIVLGPEILANAPPPVERPGLVSPRPELPPVVPETPSSPPSSGIRIGGIVLLGAGAAAAGVSVALGATALGAKSTFLADRSQPNFDRAEHLQTATNVGWIAAGVLGAAGGTLLVVSIVKKPDSSARLELVPGGGRVTASF